MMNNHYIIPSGRRGAAGNVYRALLWRYGMARLAYESIPVVRGYFLRKKMRKVKLGHSGLEVNIIGLGCMGMSEFYGQPDDGESLARLVAELAETPATVAPHTRAFLEKIDLGVFHFD